MTFVITQKNPPAYPVYHHGDHQCSINEKSIEGYRYSVECTCGWRVHVASTDDAKLFQKIHNEEYPKDKP